MKPNRAGKQAGKKGSSTQSVSSEQTASQKPVMELTDKLKFGIVAIFQVLEEHQGQFGVSELFISGMLPKFGFQSTPAQVREVLDLLERLASVSCENELWKTAHKPDAETTLWEEVKHWEPDHKREVAKELRKIADRIVRETSSEESAWNTLPQLSRPRFDNLN